MENRVLLGMSGGVDSTAACVLLQRQGFSVVGLTIDNTESDAAIEAAAVASVLGIEHHVAHERQTFDRCVAEPFAQAWLQGLTPNPCVECNPRFKFRILSEWAEKLDCQYIATGHYAGISCADGIYMIRRGADRLKDQSYFLWKLGQEVLSKTLFPLVDLTKADARAVLREAGLEAKSRDGESMEVCFIADDYREWLRRRIPDLDSLVGPGHFVDSGGRIIGTHKGFQYYTVGQRKGLQVAFGEPRYVLRTNAEKNTVMLGKADELNAGWMLLENWNFADIPYGDELQVQIRYRGAALSCVIERIVDDGRLLVRFLEPANAVTPGQSAVFYKDDCIVGGAKISSQKGLNQYIPKQL